MSHEKDKTVTLHIYPDTIQAEAMKEKLAANGIDAMVNDENVLGLDPVASVELRVFAADLTKAEEILKQH